jgi:hypothetical protein
VVRLPLARPRSPGGIVAIQHRRGRRLEGEEEGAEGRAGTSGDVLTAIRARWCREKES